MGAAETEETRPRLEHGHYRHLGGLYHTHIKIRAGRERGGEWKGRRVERGEGESVDRKESGGTEKGGRKEERRERWKRKEGRE